METTKDNREWEEFDEIWKHWSTHLTAKPLKDFINENFVAKSEVARVIEGLKKVHATGSSTATVKRKGFNAALEALKDKLHL